MTISDSMICELYQLTTRDDAGRHFTEWACFMDELEELGLIEIHRPVHATTGMVYGCEHWTVQPTENGLAVIAANPELHA